MAVVEEGVHEVLADSDKNEAALAITRGEDFVHVDCPGESADCGAGVDIPAAEEPDGFARGYSLGWSDAMQQCASACRKPKCKQEFDAQFGSVNLKEFPQFQYQEVWHGGERWVPYDEATQMQLRNVLLDWADIPVQIQKGYGNGWRYEISIEKIDPTDHIVGFQRRLPSGRRQQIRIILRPRGGDLGVGADITPSEKPAETPPSEEPVDAGAAIPSHPMSNGTRPFEGHFEFAIRYRISVTQAVALTLAVVLTSQLPRLAVALTSQLLR